jgi:hypothetical protein
METRSVALLGLGVITPRGAGLEALRASAMPLDSISKETADIAPPEGMTAREQRRQARLTRLALYAADQAARQAGARGQNAGIYMGLTHGTATFLKEFHDYLFDYGPEMASPNAFSNGVTNAPLGAISMHQKLTQGGATLVDIETCGLTVLNHAATKVLDGTHDLCYAGAAEEYSPLVEEVYLKLGWYHGGVPPHLPCALEPGSGYGFGVSEGSVVCVLGPESRNANSGLRYTPVDALDALPARPDLVLSCAGGGPSDMFELESLEALAASIGSPVPVLFSKPLVGETFAVGPMLSMAIAWDILTGRVAYPSYPLHPSLVNRFATTYDPGEIKSVLILSRSRDAGLAAGLLEASNG